MANRIVGNVLVVDSAMGNAAMLFSGGITASIVSNLYINSVSFWAANTSAAITVTEINTATDLVYVNNYISGMSASLLANANPLFFSKPQRVGILKVPTLTACTAFFYLG